MVPVCVSVQLVVGKPESTTLPVETVQVGCVMVPTIGVVGKIGLVLIVTVVETTEVHSPTVTEKVYVPLAKSDTVNSEPEPL